MQLRIHANNLNLLENIETLVYSKDKDIAKWFMKNLPGEVYEQLSPQYELNVQAGMQIRKVLGGGIFKNIKGLYWGSDQCEFLLPTLEETKIALDMWSNFDKKYTTSDKKLFCFVSPYYGNGQIRKRLIENLDYLQENVFKINPVYKYIDVVVNDFGTLKLLEKYDRLKPVLGRLLIKTLKNPLIDTYGMGKGVHVAGEKIKNKTQKEIEEEKSKIAKNQTKGISRSSLDNNYMIDFAKKYKIHRAGLDYIKNRQSLFELKDGLELDIYYPFGIVNVGRLCDTSALEKAKRGYYPIDEVCPRTCWKYDLFVKNFETTGYKLFQRGNAIFKSEINLELPVETVENFDSRLIFAPLV